MVGFTTEEVYDILSPNIYQLPGIASDGIFDLIIPISDLSENQGSTLSNDQLVELGSSSGSNISTLNCQTTTNSNQNIIPWPTDAGQETLDFPVLTENGLCSLLAYNPTTHLETGTLLSVGVDQPQCNQSYNTVFLQAQYINESSESSPINYINMMEQGPSSFDQLLQDSFGQCRSLDKSNLNIPLDEQNSAEDIIVSDYLINEYPESTIVDSHNICQEQVDLYPHSEVAQSIYMEQEINWVQTNQQHTYPVIAPQANNTISNLPNKRSGIISHGTPSFLDTVDRNNDFRNKNSQISNQYRGSLPQNSSELQVGNVNERQLPIPYQQQALWPSNAHSTFNTLSSQSEPQMSYDVWTPFGERQNSYNYFDSQNPVFRRSEVQMPPNIPNPLLDSYHSSVPLRPWLPLSSNDDARPNQVPAVMTSAPILFSDIRSRFNRYNWPDSNPSRTTTSSDYPHTLYRGPFRMPNLIEILQPVTLAPKDYAISGRQDLSYTNRRLNAAINDSTSLFSQENFQTDKQNTLFQKGKQKAVVDYSSPLAVGESWCPSTSYKGKSPLLPMVSDDLSTKRIDHFREKYPQNINIAPRLARNDAYDSAYESRDGGNKRMRFDKN